MVLLRRAAGALVRIRAFSVLRYREYRLLWCGQLFGTMGFWMDEVTRGWLIYELTDSAVQLGLVRGVQAVPFLLFAPLAGSAADRYSRKTQLVIAQILHALVYAVTAALVFSGHIRPWHVYVSAFLVASVQIFQQPARASMISDAVPQDYLPNAIGLNSLMFNVSRGAGPALAGALIVTVGTGGAFAAQALFLAAASLLTLPMNPLRRVRPPGTRESFLRSIAEGWKFSWHSEPVRAGLLCTMLAAFFIVPFTTLLPVFARDLLGVGATGQGFLLTAMAIGAFASAALVANAGHKLPRGRMMLISGMFYGLSIVAFAVSGRFELSLALMLVAGLFHVHCSVLVQTVIQSYSPPEFRGRTMAIFGMNQAVITVGAALYGALSTIEGARLSLVMMGLAGSASMVALYFGMPKARLIK